MQGKGIRLPGHAVARRNAQYALIDANPVGLVVYRNNGGWRRCGADFRPVRPDNQVIAVFFQKILAVAGLELSADALGFAGEQRNSALRAQLKGPDAAVGPRKRLHQIAAYHIVLKIGQHVIDPAIQAALGDHGSNDGFVHVGRVDPVEVTGQKQTQSYCFLNGPVSLLNPRRARVSLGQARDQRGDRGDVGLRRIVAGRVDRAHHAAEGGAVEGSAKGLQVITVGDAG